MSKNGIKKLDLINKTITLNSTLCAGLRKGRAESEARYQELSTIYPQFKFVFTSHKNTSKSKSSITYDRMAEILTNNGKPQLMEEINNMRFAREIDEKKNKIALQYTPSQVRQRFYQICKENQINPSILEAETPTEHLQPGDVA